MRFAEGQSVRRFIFLFLLLPACALAQSGVWGLRGITKRFVIHGNIVYAVDGRGVAAYDATTLKRIAVAETDAESLDAAFTGDTLVVLTRTGLARFTSSLALIDRQPLPPARRRGRRTRRHRRSVEERAALRRERAGHAARVPERGAAGGSAHRERHAPVRLRLHLRRKRHRERQRHPAPRLRRRAGRRA